VSGVRAGVEVLLVEVTREAARRGAAIVWVTARCPYCRRRHRHIADPLLTEAVIPAGCDAAKFYRVREVSP
jgi:hypothetical protein